jgi:hypothetical protein
MAAEGLDTSLLQLDHPRSVGFALTGRCQTEQRQPAGLLIDQKLLGFSAGTRRAAP